MDINQVLKDASKEIELASSQADLQNLKVSYLGKKGKITELLKSLKDLSLEEKKTVGAQINFLRDNVDSLIKEKLLEIKKDEINSKLLNESIDFSFQK
jgi:phenylalanyl-tRNA synthetase alpha chain